MSGEGQRRTLQIVGKPLIFSVTANAAKEEATSETTEGLQN
jgi:hypothetical protein